MFDSCLIRSVLNFQCTENNDFVFRFDSLVLPDEKCLLLAAVLGSVQPLQALLSLKNIKIFVKVREEGGGKICPPQHKWPFCLNSGSANLYSYQTTFRKISDYCTVGETQKQFLEKSKSTHPIWQERQCRDTELHMHNGYTV